MKLQQSFCERWRTETTNLKRIKFTTIYLLFGNFAFLAMPLCAFGMNVTMTQLITADENGIFGKY